MADYLFVYGTLMRGLEAHDRLAPERARFLGEGTCRGQLYDLGPYPALRGELYELLDLDLLPELDAFEAYHGRGGACMFSRCKGEVETDEGAVSAWIYAFNPHRPLSFASLIETGDYRAHTG